ncbi:SRPBCC family protein [Actinoplanes subglobosus]|uniref:SRPBCC family protein n=1 Tax=Actinoplanes subglobosus TaxID=1547892 RepID=A0ABV8IK50_9ACTN
MRFDVDTTATPEQVWSAFTDFSDRRLRIWSRTLDPRRYEVRAQGDAWAVARESTPGSPFWVVVRYDWSTPSVIRWTVEESSYGGGGDGEVRISPAPGGGSHVQAAWTYTDARPLQRPLLYLLQRRPMAGMIARMWTDALNRCATTS